MSGPISSTLCKICYIDQSKILCVLLAADGTWAATQKKLLHAGLRAGISRFAPAEFGVGPLGDHQIDMFQPALEIAEACREAKKTHPGFEYACFHVGLFMNYLGYGARDEKAATHEMRDEWVFIFDVKGMKADIPLARDGSVPRMTFTEIGDVGRFAAAACLLPKGAWKEDFSMVGDTLSLDEMVRVIEKVRGRKMQVTYRPYEQVEREEQENEIVYPNGMWLQIELLVAQNIVGGSIVEPIVNGLCPDVRPVSVEEYMRRFWSVE